MPARDSTLWARVWHPKYFFQKIVSKAEAQKTLREIGLGFYVLAGIQFLIGCFMFRSLIIDSVCFSITGYSLRNYQSRVAASIAVCITLIGIYVTASNMATRKGPANIVVAIMMLMYSIRAVQASFTYHRLAKSRISAKNVIIKSFVGLVFACIVGLVGMIGVLVVSGNPQEPNEEMLGYTLLGSIFLSLALAYRGWLPFTRRRPFVLRGE